MAPVSGLDGNFNLIYKFHKNYPKKSRLKGRLFDYFGDPFDPKKLLSNDTNVLSIFFASANKLNNAINLRKEGMIPTNAHIFAWVNFRSSLTNNNFTCSDELATKTFYAKPLRF
jgi:hypothetical protein